MAKVLVLGASGFIGTELVRQLQERGDAICAMVHHNGRAESIGPIPTKEESSGAGYRLRMTVSRKSGIFERESALFFEDHT